MNLPITLTKLALEPELFQRILAASTDEARSIGLGMDKRLAAAGRKARVLSTDRMLLPERQKQYKNLATAAENRLFFGQPEWSWK